jgi:hypothetical protein
VLIEGCRLGSVIRDWFCSEAHRFLRGSESGRGLELTTVLLGRSILVRGRCDLSRGQVPSGRRHELGQLVILRGYLEAPWAEPSLFIEGKAKSLVMLGPKGSTPVRNNKQDLFFGANRPRRVSE